MKEILPDADDTELMKMAVRMPDTLKTEREEIDEKEWQEIQKVIKSSLTTQEIKKRVNHLELRISQRYIR